MSQSEFNGVKKTKRRGFHPSLCFYSLSIAQILVDVHSSAMPRFNLLNRLSFAQG